MLYSIYFFEDEAHNYFTDEYDTVYRLGVFVKSKTFATKFEGFELGKNLKETKNLENRPRILYSSLAR